MHRFTTSAFIMLIFALPIPASAELCGAWVEPIRTAIADVCQRQIASERSTAMSHEAPSQYSFCAWRLAGGTEQSDPASNASVIRWESETSEQAEKAYALNREEFGKMTYPKSGSKIEDIEGISQKAFWDPIAQRLVVIDKSTVFVFSGCSADQTEARETASAIASSLLGAKKAA